MSIDTRFYDVLLYTFSRENCEISLFFFPSFFVRLSFETHSTPSSSKRGDDESTIIVFSGEKERKRVFPFDYRVGKDIGDRIGSRSARDPEVIEGNTIPGTGYPVYKKKSVMVSDTRGNKSFLAVRMRKTSLLSLSLSFSPLRTLRLSIRVIHARLACVDIRVEQEYRDDAISTYVTRPNVCIYLGGKRSPTASSVRRSS